MLRSVATDRVGASGRVSGSMRTLFDVGTLCGLTDGQLLERFLRGPGDAAAEAAFTALVERHGPMVLAACRAVLGDRHDAEDACQAAFLVLARRAGAIRRGDSVASWLYGVARRLAMRARRDAARRRGLERRRPGRAAAGEPASATPPEPWPELYEELDRLAEPFRAAVVLCDLEGHSYERAASLLHCPVGTVQSRLARGRQRLRIRLERRGIVPAVALAGRGAAPAGLSPQLTDEIARAAVGIGAGRTIVAAAPAAVAAMAGAEVRRQFMSRALTTLTTLVMAGVVATAAIGLAAVGRGDDPKDQGTAAAKKTEAGPIHVRVIDLEGKGSPGIAVEVQAWDQPARSFTTDDDGGVTIPRDVIGESSFLVARRGHDAIAWSPPSYARPKRPAGTEGDPIVMRLLPLDHRVEGSVADRAGKPIAGVALRVASLSEPTNGWVYPSETILEPLLPPPSTDRAGRFTMMLPRGARGDLRALHPRFIGHHIPVEGDARALPPLTLIPAGGITGRVIDATSGKPVVGAVVFAQLIEDHQQIFGGSGDARSDERGRFTLNGLEPGVYNLSLSRVPGRPGATARTIEGVRVRADADTPADLAVIDGRPLRGVVIDRNSGRPVPGIDVGYKGPARPFSGAAVVMQKTDEHGHFTFHVPPGEQYVYVADGSENNRLAHRSLVVPEHGEIEPVRLMRRIGPPRNPPVALAEAAAPPIEKVAAPRPIGPRKVEVAEVEASGPEAAKVQEGVNPPAPVARTTTRTVTGNGDGDVPVKAPDPNARTVIGHLRDSQGRPVPGIHLGVSGRGDGAATDRDGMFELSDVPRGELRIHLRLRHGKFQHETIAADRDRVELTLPPEIASPADDGPVPPKDEPIPSGLRDRLTFVDLEPWGTDYLADGPAEGGNDLNRLPRGVHKLGETFFRVGEKMIHLQGRLRPELPQAVKGIKVQAHGRVLHVLHATQYGGDAGILIGAYVVHYADGTSERIPIAYGRNLVNWWSFPRAPEEPTEARVAWTGTNESSDLNPGLKIRLFDMSWTNPHPDKEIATLDVLSAGKDCDPFVVGVTLERP